MIQALEGISAAVLVAAAVHDVATRTIPNSVPALLALLGIAIRVLDGGLLSSIAAVSLLFAAGAFVWRMGWLGGGDVKLVPAFGLVLPPGQVGAFVLATAVAGGVLALLYLVLRPAVPAPAPGRRRGRLRRCLKAEAWRISRGGPLPYAIAIAAGGLYVLHPSLHIG